MEIPKEFEGKLVSIESIIFESCRDYEVWYRGYIENGEFIIYANKYEFESHDYDVAFPWGYLPNLPHKLVLCSFVEKTPASKKELLVINKFWKIFPEYIPTMSQGKDFKCNHEYEEKPNERYKGLKFIVCKKCRSYFDICKKCKASYHFHETFSGYCPKCQKLFNIKIEEFEKSIGYEPYKKPGLPL